MSSSDAQVGPALDPDVIRRAKQGEKAAVEQLFGEHLTTVHRFALRMCRNEEHAKDIAQESLLTALNSLEGFRGEASFSTWLFTITRNHCGRFRHKSDREAVGARQDITTNEMESDEITPDEHAIENELTGVVELALGTLDEGEREVLLLRDVEGLSTKESADVLGVSVSALKSRLHRARKTLRERVRSMVSDSPETTDPACPDTLLTFSRKLEGDLSERDCDRIEKHLAECPTCARKCDSLREILGACASLKNKADREAATGILNRTLNYVRNELSPGSDDPDR